MELLCIAYLCIGAILALCTVGMGLTEEIPQARNLVHSVTVVLISGAIAVLVAFTWFPILCHTIIKISRSKRKGDGLHKSGISADAIPEPGYIS